MTAKTEQTTTHFQGVQKYALGAYKVYVESKQRNYPLFEALATAVHQATVARVHEAATSDDEGVGTLIETVDGPLYIAEINKRGDGTMNVIMTSDGYSVGNDWYNGEDYDFADTVRYEDWTFGEDGKLTERYHGWAEVNSRKVVQSG